MLGNGSRPTGGSADNVKQPQPGVGIAAAQKSRNLLMPGAQASSTGSSLFKINVKRALEAPTVAPPTSTANDETATTKPKPAFSKPHDRPQDRGNKRTFISSSGVFAQMSATSAPASKRVAMVPKGARQGNDGPKVGEFSTSRGDTIVKLEKPSPRKIGEVSPSKQGDSKVTAIDLTRLPPFEFYTASSDDQSDPAADLKCSRAPVRLPLCRTLLSGMKSEKDQKSEKPGHSSDLSETLNAVARPPTNSDVNVDMKPELVLVQPHNSGMFDDLEFVLLELPDAFPLCLRDGERDSRANESAESNSGAQQQTGAKATQGDMKPSESVIAAQSASRTTRNGPVGYIEVCESGRFSMVINDANEANLVHRFELSSVADAGFLQDVCLLCPNSETDGAKNADLRPEFIKFGAVRKRVLCVPEIDSLLEFDDA